VEAVPTDCKEAFLKIPTVPYMPVSIIASLFELLPKNIKWYILFNDIEIIPLKEEVKEYIVKYPQNMTAHDLTTILQLLPKDKKYSLLPSNMEVREANE
jgi:hypothetical protein